MADAVSLSTEIAYFTYMYANVDRSHYRKVTSYSHFGLHLGRFLGGLTGQLMLSTNALQFDGLNYLSLGGVSISLLLSIFLPTVRRSIYFDPRFSVISTFSGQNPSIGRTSDAIGNAAVATRKMAVALPKPKQVGVKKRIIRACRALGRDFKIAYTNRYVLKWSLWWSIAQAIYLQVGIYAEPLWREIEEETHESIYNGVIDASHALLSIRKMISLAFTLSVLVVIISRVLQVRF